MEKIKIQLTNTRCRLMGDIKIANKLRNELRFRHPNAWFLRKHMPKGWDGHVYDISENWTIKVGLIPKLIDKCIELGIDFEVLDNRELPKLGVIPKKISEGFILRDYQYEALLSIVHNALPDGTGFPIGVVNAATNAGKSLMAVALHKSYKNVKTLLLLNSSDLFNQGLNEYPQMMPDENIGFIQGKKYNKWGNFTVAMVQTLSRNLKYFKNKLSDIDIVIVDECDLADNKTYKNVLNNLYNSPIRIGLSGSIYLSKLKKHQLKNNNLMSFFGQEIFNISKAEMVKKGYSSNLVIKISEGGKDDGERTDYKSEYDRVITQNTQRTGKIIERIAYNLSKGRIPLMVVCKYHEHVDRVFEAVKLVFGNDFEVEYVHHKVADRENIITGFREGKVDILVASLIIKRGQNLPLMRCLINAAGGDSEENVIQIMGRGERKHHTKTKTYLEDFFDEGHYLRRHSKHRINYYHKQGFKVIKLHLSETIKNKNHAKKK